MSKMWFQTCHADESGVNLFDNLLVTIMFDWMYERETSMDGIKL